jgi:hypothetical protein
MADARTLPVLPTTTDMALYRLREHCAHVRAMACAGADTLLAVELFLSLDDALCSTGVLPLDWTDAKRNMIINGLPKQPAWAFTAEEPDDDDDVIQL